MDMQKIKEKIGLDWAWLMKQQFDHQYDYLINNYIPGQGQGDMRAFIIFGFDAYTYLLWKLCNNDFIKNREFEKAIKERVMEVFREWP